MNANSRRLSQTTAIALIIANMIGAGVFTTSGFSLAELGSPGRVLAAWTVGGVLAICGAISYGALARLIPSSGGEYTFLSQIFHPFAGFTAGWISLLAGFTAPIAAAAHVLEAYASAATGLTLASGAVGSIAILVAGLMHGFRVEIGARLQNGVVGLKLLAILAFIAFGWFQLPARPAPAELQPFEIGAFSVALVWISFAYSGWNAAVYVAGEVRDPDRTLFRSLWLATAGVTGLYLALNAIFVFAAPVADLAGRPDIGAVAAEALGGAGLRRALSALVVVALFTSVSSMTMAGPRVYAQMAEDGLFPVWFKAQAAVPRAAVTLQVGLALVVFWIAPLAQLLSYIGFTLGLSAAATVFAAVVARRRAGPEEMPFPGYPWIPAIFIGFTLIAAAFMATRRPSEALLGLITVAAAAPIFWLRGMLSQRAERH